MPTIANIAKINGIVISGAPAVSDAHTLIATATASASATLSFTLGLDSLYDAYEFRFDNIHPATDGVDFQFQVNAAGQAGFNEVITSTTFSSKHTESDSVAALGYVTGMDQAQGSAYQSIGSSVTGFDNDQSQSGILTLYAPSSTTYVKHFTSVGNGSSSSNYSFQLFAAGYINVTAAIDEISFKMSSGNIDLGVIKMYGIAKA
jgi:hypothetical protein